METGSRRRGPSRGPIAAACAVLALAIVAAAHAQAPPSGVDQYAELVPAAGGPTAPGTKKETRARLPKTSEEALEHVAPATAKSLEKISTSSNYGAPPSRPEPRVEPKPLTREPDLVPREAAEQGALSSAVRAAGSGDDARLIAMLAVMFMTTVGAVTASIRRTRTAG